MSVGDGSDSDCWLMECGYITCVGECVHGGCNGHLYNTPPLSLASQWLSTSTSHSTRPFNPTRESPIILMLHERCIKLLTNIQNDCLRKMGQTFFSGTDFVTRASALFAILWLGKAPHDGVCGRRHMYICSLFPGRCELSWLLGVHGSDSLTTGADQ